MIELIELMVDLTLAGYCTNRMEHLEIVPE